MSIPQRPPHMTRSLYGDRWATMKALEHEHAVAKASWETLVYVLNATDAVGEPDEVQYLKSLIQTTVNEIKASGWRPDL